VPTLSAVLPDADMVEVLTILPSNAVRLSDGREFGVKIFGSSSMVDDVFESSEPGDVFIHGVSRELHFSNGDVIRFYPKPDVVTVTLVDGTQASIALAELRGLGTSGIFTEPENARQTFRAFRFDNGITGTVDRTNGFDITLKDGRTVKVKRKLGDGVPGNDAPMTQPFTCRRCAS
jgi:hypothetical protein